MESTGIPNKIQVSQETADLLIAAGKKDWLTQRNDVVSVKGKGELVTFFLNNKTSCDAGSNHDSFKTIRSEVLDSVENAEAEGFHRITEWTVEVMAGLLKDIVTCRKVVGSPKRSQAKLAALERDVSLLRQDGKFTVIDEVQEIIELPDFRHQKTQVLDIPVDPQALEELREYIRAIARMYNNNRKWSSCIVDWDWRLPHHFFSLFYPSLEIQHFTTLSMRIMSPCPSSSYSVASWLPISKKLATRAWMITRMALRLIP
jgi:hypothetical protein